MEVTYNVTSSFAPTSPANVWVLNLFVPNEVGGLPYHLVICYTHNIFYSFLRTRSPHDLGPNLYNWIDPTKLSPRYYFIWSFVLNTTLQLVGDSRQHHNTHWYKCVAAADFSLFESLKSQSLFMFLLLCNCLVYEQNAAEKLPFFLPSWTGVYILNTFVVVWVFVVGFGFGGWASMSNFIKQVDTFGLFAKCYQCPPKTPTPVHH